MNRTTMALDARELKTVFPQEIQIGDRVCVTDSRRVGTVVAIRGHFLVITGLDKPVFRRRCFYVPSPDDLVERVRQLHLAKCHFAGLTDEETQIYMSNWESRQYRPEDDESWA